MIATQAVEKCLPRPVCIYNCRERTVPTCMKTDSEIKAVIFDMGGVILRTENKTSRAELAARYGMTYDEMDAFVFHSDTASAATEGQITEDQHWQDVARRLNLSPQELPAFIAAFWGGDVIDRDLHRFIGGLRPRYRTALLSNAWSGARQAMEEKYHVLDVFDITVFSYEVHLAKPSPAIFQLVLDRLGVEPRQAIFVDDFLSNVEAARALGIHGVHFRNSAQARAEILSLLGEA